jgi:hypothetical protein
MHAIQSAAGRYASFVDAALARALRHATRELSEPRVGDPARAVRLVAPLVETLTGFAIGTIASELLRGMRRWVGADSVSEVRARLGIEWPRACRDARAAECTPYLHDASHRPLVNELACSLHLRFCRMSRDVAQLIATAQQCARSPSNLDVMLGLLAQEEHVEQRVAAEIAFGWTMYLAALARRTYPATDQRSARSQALWLAWQHQLDGAPAATRTELQESGYIMLVA